MNSDMEYEEFYNSIMSQAKDRPDYIRLGQFVFNYIDSMYGDVARHVQFDLGIDCFHRDDITDDFIQAVYDCIKDKMSIFDE